MAYVQEQLLIRCCSRSHLNRDIVNRIDLLLNSGLNWAYIVREAQAQGTAPLLYYHSSCYGEKLPSNTLSKLKKIFGDVEDTNLKLSQELKKILTCLNENNIKPILLKGIDLVGRVYPQRGLRPMTDIDLLIKKQDLLKIEELLSSLDYLMYPGFRKILNKPTSPYLNAVVCKKLKAPYVSLHLHWHILNYTFYPGYGYISRLDIDKIWQEAEHTQVEKVQALRMASHHLLLHLAEHSFKHYFDRLILLTDIDTFLNHYRGSLDWQRIIEDAFEFNFPRPLYYSLYLASHILGTKVPKDILFKLEPTHMSNFENKFVNSVLKARPSRNLSFFMFLAMNKGIEKKIRFCFRTFLPHPQFRLQLQEIQGIRSSFQYTLRRLIRIFKYTLSLFLRRS